MNLLKEIEIKTFENKEVSSLKIAEDKLKKVYKLLSKNWTFKSKKLYKHSNTRR